jgi:PqqD family protein of HPr-rel-A system
MSSPPPHPKPAAGAVPVAAAQVTAVGLDDDLVLYDARTTQAHVLNASAARIWQLCDGSRTLAVVIQELSTAYGIEYAQAEADVNELVASLQSAGLLTMI